MLSEVAIPKFVKTIKLSDIARIRANNVENSFVGADRSINTIFFNISEIIFVFESG